MQSVNCLVDFHDILLLKQLHSSWLCVCVCVCVCVFMETHNTVHWQVYIQADLGSVIISQLYKIQSQNVTGEKLKSNLCLCDYVVICTHGSDCEHVDGLRAGGVPLLYGLNSILRTHNWSHRMLLCRFAIEDASAEKAACLFPPTFWIRLFLIILYSDTAEPICSGTTQHVTFCMFPCPDEEWSSEGRNPTRGHPLLFCNLPHYKEPHWAEPRPSASCTEPLKATSESGVWSPVANQWPYYELSS